MTYDMIPIDTLQNSMTRLPDPCTLDETKTWLEFIPQRCTPYGKLHCVTACNQPKGTGSCAVQLQGLVSGVLSHAAPIIGPQGPREKVRGHGCKAGSQGRDLAPVCG